MKNKICPDCGKPTLQFIEVCNEDDFEKKTSWGCDDCNNIVYIVTLK